MIFKAGRVALCVVVVGMMLAGCGGGGADEAAGSVEVSSSTAGMPTIPVDPWAVPEVIDVAYVSRVMNEIESILDQATDDVYFSHTYSERTEQMLKDIYAEPYLSSAQSQYSDASARSGDQIRRDKQPSLVAVKRLTTARPDCVHAIVMLDSNPARVEYREPAEFGVTLRRSEAVGSWNKTGWLESVFRLAGEDGSGNVDQCVS